jgi:hypothetical protein
VKSFFIPALCLMLVLMLSACRSRGAQASPTVNPADLQGTIAAAAFTIVAETSAAIPTATPLPPTATSTDTPAPTLTPLPLPSSAVTLTSAPGGNSSGTDPCINKTLPESLQGDPIRIRLNNSTRATLSLTVYLNQTGPQGVCGYRSYTLDPGQFIVLNDLVEGCYTLWAWNPDPDTYFIVTNGTNCLDTSDTWVFDISTSSIKLGP